METKATEHFVWPRLAVRLNAGFLGTGPIMCSWMLLAATGMFFATGHFESLRAQDIFLREQIADTADARSAVQLQGRLPAGQEAESIWPTAFSSEPPQSPAGSMPQGTSGTQAGAALRQGSDPAAEGNSDLASDFTNPTKLLTSYQFNTWYHPSFWGAKGSGTEFMARPVIPIPTSSLIPVDQIVRVWLPVETMPVWPNGQNLPDGLMDVEIFDLAIFPVTRDLTFAA